MMHLFLQGHLAGVWPAGLQYDVCLANAAFICLLSLNVLSNDASLVHLAHKSPRFMDLG